MLTVVQLNLAFDERLASPDALLANYHTLTGWSAAMSQAGASVQTVQRFSADARQRRDAVEYVFVADNGRGTPRPWDEVAGTVAVVSAAQPDVVHVNGLLFPAAVVALRAALPDVAIVLQDHSGALPRTLPWPLDRLTTARWSQAFAVVDACTFTAAELADRWRAAGLPASVPIIEIPEASTTLTPIDRREAARRTGMNSPLELLWVGRLEPGKDPMTMLDALEQALPHLPEAHATMIFEGGQLEAQVRTRVSGSSALNGHVALAGAVPHERVADYYSAADVFVSASRHEGSGYALIEALAAGVTPCVTDIPAFRALAGPVGVLWTPGDAAACAAALRTTAHLEQRPSRAAIRDYFATTLDWPVVGHRTVEAYTALVARRRR
jgi:glycosyltransferase involved in cell wall biosynthesis